MTTEISFNSAALAPVGEGLRAFFSTPAAVVAPPATPKNAAESPAAVSAVQSLDDAVRELSDYVAQSGAELNFRIDEDSGRVVVSLVDSRDGTVLRQMPSEEALRIARSLSQCEPCLIEAQA